MHIECDRVNCCPFYSKETIIVDIEYEEPVFDLCGLCLKDNNVGYCFHDGIKEECEVYNEEE